MPLLLLLLLLPAPLPALAVTVFDDGGVHVIDGPLAGAEVLDSSTVLVLDHGDVVADTSFSRNAIESRDGHIGVHGGLIEGQPLLGTCLSTGGLARNIDGESCSFIPASYGIWAIGGTVTVTSGEVVGTAAGVFALDVPSVVLSGGLLRGEIGGAGMSAGGDSIVVISGGTLEGASTSGAGAFSVSGSSSSFVTGGAFIGGSSEPDPSARGASLLVREAAYVEIRGGTFEGPWVIRGPGAMVEVFAREHRPGTGCPVDDECAPNTTISAELEDGTPLLVEVILEDGASPPLIHVLPEPSAVMLWLAVLGTLPFLRRSG